MKELYSNIAIYVTDFAEWLQQFAGLDSKMPDIGYNGLVIVFVVFIVLLVGFSLGKSRMLLALVSLYVAAFISSRFIFSDELQGALESSGLELQRFMIHLGFFIIVYAAVILILGHSFLKTKLTLSEASTMTVIFLGLLSVGFLASVLVGYIPENSVLPIPENTVRYFGTPTAQFVWALLPIIGVLFMKEERD